MVPLADIFNHKASVVLLGDAWGVAELAGDLPHSHSDGGEPSSDHEEEGGSEHGGGDTSDGAEERPGSSSSGSDAQHEHQQGHEHAEGEGHSEEGSEAASEEGSEEDAQHGFAVGGMPLIQSAGPATAEAAAADGCRANGSSGGGNAGKGCLWRPLWQLDLACTQRCMHSDNTSSTTALRQVACGPDCL